MKTQLWKATEHNAFAICFTGDAVMRDCEIKGIFYDTLVNEFSYAVSLKDAIELNALD